MTKPAEPETILDTVNAVLDSSPPIAHTAPDAEQDRAYLRLLTSALRRNVEELKAEIQSRERAEAEIQRHRARLQVLADASRAFAEVGLDYRILLDKIARTITDVLGGGCAISVISEDGVWLRQVALYDTDFEKFALLRSVLSDAPLRVDEPSVTTRVFQSSQPLFLPIVDPSQLRAAMKPEFWSLHDRLDIHSMLGVPMRVHGRPIGIVTLFRHQLAQQPFDEDDLTLTQDLADRAALAIENARLYRDVRAEVERLPECGGQLLQVLDSLPMAAYICDTDRLIAISTRVRLRCGAARRNSTTPPIASVAHSGCFGPTAPQPHTINVGWRWH